MIDVFDLMAKGQIEDGAVLKVFEDSGYSFEFLYQNAYRTFLDEEHDEIHKYFAINSDFLNLEVHLEQPNERKYHIKLPYSNVYIGFAFNEDGEKEIIPYSRGSISELIIQLAEKNGLVFKTQFTKQDFEEIKEIQLYKQYKKLVKDDEK